MVQHTTSHHLGKTDLGLDPFDISPDIQEVVQQAIVFLLGYHNSTGFWKPLNTDVDGRLLVSLSDIEVSTFEIKRVTVDTTADLIDDSNPSRRSITLQNLGPSVLYIGPDNTVTTATGFPVGVGSTFNDDIYTGAWYGIVAAGSAEVAVLEV